MDVFSRGIIVTIRVNGYLMNIYIYIYIYIYILREKNPMQLEETRCRLQITKMSRYMLPR